MTLLWKRRMAPRLAVMLLAFFSAFSLLAVDYAEARKFRGGGGGGGRGG